MTTNTNHQITHSETPTIYPTEQHPTHQQTDTTKIYKTQKTNAHLCITIKRSGRSLTVTEPGRLFGAASARVVDLGGWC